MKFNQPVFNYYPITHSMPMAHPIQNLSNYSNMPNYVPNPNIMAYSNQFNNPITINPQNIIQKPINHV